MNPSGQGEQALQKSNERLALKAFTIIAVIVVLALGIAFFGKKLLNLDSAPDEEEFVYNGFEFSKVSGLWYTYWQRDGQIFELEFRHSPRDVEDIPIAGQLDDRFQTQQTFITFDPNDELSKKNAYVALAAVDLTNKLVAVFDRDVTAACIANVTEACSKRPIVSCSSTNASVIYLRNIEDENDTKIILDGNCATFQGKDEELVKAAEKALYKWLGIIRRE